MPALVGVKVERKIAFSGNKGFIENVDRDDALCADGFPSFIEQGNFWQRRIWQQPGIVYFNDSHSKFTIKSRSHDVA